MTTYLVLRDYLGVIQSAQSLCRFYTPEEVKFTDVSPLHADQASPLDILRCEIAQEAFFRIKRIVPASNTCVMTLNNWSSMILTSYSSSSVHNICGCCRQLQGVSGVFRFFIHQPYKANPLGASPGGRIVLVETGPVRPFSKLSARSC